MINKKTAQHAPGDNQQPVVRWPIPVLEESVHYYMENGFMVFTEAYHRARGSCCGNGCRHCPFEYVNVKQRKPNDGIT